MKLKSALLTFGIVIASLSLYNCKKDGGGVNIFSLQDDRDFGAQTEAQIAKDPATYPILDSVQYKPAYDMIHRITNNILNSGKVGHKNDFVWRVKIINDSKTLNAFCTPGGYIYVYTGLIRYLDTEDQLAGVMGHEIAHADLRHSTDAMTREYGISMMLDYILGKQSAITQIGSQLLSLKYSRGHETQADEYSVIYLANTNYQCSGAAGFFQKLIAEGSSGGTPVFLSTHPGDADRVSNITKKATELGCKSDPITGSDYGTIKASLPVQQ